MSERVVVLYRLKDGVDREAYREWSRSVDQPITREQPAVSSFEVFLTDPDADPKPAHDVIEVIEVSSWEEWQRTLAGEGMARVMKEWPAYGVEDGLVAIHGAQVG